MAPLSVAMSDTSLTTPQYKQEDDARCFLRKSGNHVQPTGLVGVLAVVGAWHSPFNLLKPTGHVMHQQFNIQQMYALPTLYLCVLYLSENKQRLVPLTA